MKQLLPLLLAFAIADVAIAGTVEIKIPRQAWSISFESPPLTDKYDERKGGDYSLVAKAYPFFISLFVEKPRGVGDTHKACYEYYWARLSASPSIVKDTVLSSETEKYIRVQYDSESTVQGRTLRQKTVHYYAAYQGKWIDLHVSDLHQVKDDENPFATIDKTLSYGP